MVKQTEKENAQKPNFKSEGLIYLFYHVSIIPNVCQNVL